jgi:hypothetical protein
MQLVNIGRNSSVVRAKLLERIADSLLEAPEKRLLSIGCSW